MGKYLGHPRVLGASLILLMVAFILGVASMPALRPAALLARHWSRQLPYVPDDHIVAHLARIADLEEAASGVLVEALGSQRAVLSSAAASELHRQLDRWSAQRSVESSPKVARLAELLASEVEQWDGPSRSAAADLAERILRWPIHSQHVRRAEVMAHCEIILRGVASDGPSPSVAAASDEGSVGKPAIAASQSETDPRGIFSEISLAAEAGGGLPIEETAIPPFPPSLEGSFMPRPIDGDQPRLMPTLDRQLPYVMFPENEGSVAESPLPALPATPAPRELDAPLADDPKVTELPPAAEKRLEYELQQLPELDLIRRLGDPRPWMAAAIESQLESRGFKEHELNLARIVASADAQKRSELAASLDRLTNSPSRWLYWLSFDPDPSVRRKVVSIMATSQDPRLQLRLRQLLTTELDTGVREALRQWDDTATKRR